MQPDQIKEALKAWGHAVQNRFAVSGESHSRHALAKALDLAPGTTENAMRQLLGRDGTSRRTFMAQKTSTDKLQMRILPTWAVDPVRASNDADRPHDNPEIPVDMGIPEHLRWIDRLVRVMDQEQPLMAACIRQEYCAAGSQAAKARRVNDQLKFGMVQDSKGIARPRFRVWMYRNELERAVAWIQGFAAAA
jgi:hypothetical protein